MTTEQYSIGYDAGYQDGFDVALAQPMKQEPIGWTHAANLVDDGYGHIFSVYSSEPAYDDWVPVYATPVDSKAIRALKLVYDNSTSHDWPEDIWEAIEDALK